MCEALKLEVPWVWPASQRALIKHSLGPLEPGRDGCKCPSYWEFRGGCCEMTVRIKTGATR